MTTMQDLTSAISHLAESYLLIGGIRAESEDNNIQLSASIALVSISQAQEKAFEIKAKLED